MPVTKSNAGKTLKQCPNCGATVFQGPFQRGPIVNGKHDAQETLWQCVNCNRVSPVDGLADHEVEVPLAEL